MIYLLFGNNEFEKRQRLAQITNGLERERHDGETIKEPQLRDLLQGQTLFASQRAVIIDDLSLNENELWQKLPDILKDDQDLTLILLENKPDKRTKTYKRLQKIAKIEEFAAFNERQKSQLVNWCIKRAAELGFTLEKTHAETIIDRLGYDQLRLDNILSQLSLMPKINQQLLDKILPLPKTENIFELFEATLNGDRKKVHQIIEYFEMTEGQDGAYKTFGLIVSQAVNLSALVLSGGSPAKVAADFSINPYALRNLSALATSVNEAKLSNIIHNLSRADEKMKTTSVSPWLIVETALMKIAKNKSAI